MLEGHGARLFTRRGQDRRLGSNPRRTTMNTRAQVAVFVLAAFFASAAMANPLAKTAKEIMGKINKGANATVIMLKRELQKDSPNWPEIQGQTKEYAALAGELKDAKPAKGDAASWSKLTKEFAETAKTMDEAAKKKDKSGAL